MKKSIVVLLMMVLAFSLVACSSNSASNSNSAPNSNQTSTAVPTATDAPTPEKAVTAVSDGILRLNQGPAEKFGDVWFNNSLLYNSLVFRRLLAADENVQPTKKDLATDYTISQDGLTYTFTLMDDVKWHDGKPFTAEDVKWSFEASLKASSFNAFFASVFSKIEGAQAWMDNSASELSGVTINGNIVTVKLTDPVGAFLTVMTQWSPLPKHLLEQEDPLKIQIADFWAKPIGNGPYMFTEVNPNNFAVLEPFTEYTGPKPKIAKILLQTITSEQTLPKAQAEELDYLSTLDKSLLDEILKIPNYEAVSVNMIYGRILMANLTGPEGTKGGNKKIGDIRVRKALLYALDREAISNKLFPGQASPLNTLIPSTMLEYNKSAEQYLYDPEKAKTLLKEADFDFSQTIKLQYYYGDQGTIDLIDTIKFYWEEIGVKVETAIMQGDVVDLIYKKRDYDFLYAGHSGTMLEEVYANFDSTSDLMAGIYGTEALKEWDSIISELSRTSEIGKRLDIVKSMQQKESEYLFQLPLFSLKPYIVVNKAHLQTAGIYGNEWTVYDRMISHWEMK